MIKVLLVEDNIVDANLAKAMLAEGGPGQVQVTHVDRLSGALRCLAREQYDAILLNLSLLDTHGLETFTQIQAAIPRVPIVFMSRSGDPSLALTAIRHGAQDYLSKDLWSGDMLLRSIRFAIERKRGEQGLSYLAQYDQVTDLANRALFRDRVVQALARAKRKQQGVGLMVLALDGFKTIKDSLGQDKSDALLRAVAERIKGCLREVDTAGRLERDEFTVLLEGVNGERDVTLVAQRILETIAKPVELEGSSASVTASIGLTLYPLDDHPADDLLKHAAKAMHQAEDQEGNRYQFYVADPDSSSEGHSALPSSPPPEVTT